MFPTIGEPSFIAKTFNFVKFAKFLPPEKLLNFQRNYLISRKIQSRLPFGDVRLLISSKRKTEIVMLNLVSNNRQPNSRFHLTARVLVGSLCIDLSTDERRSRSAPACTRSMFVVHRSDGFSSLWSRKVLALLQLLDRRRRWLRSRHRHRTLRRMCFSIIRLY